MTQLTQLEWHNLNLSINKTVVLHILQAPASPLCLFWKESRKKMTSNFFESSKTLQANIVNQFGKRYLKKKKKI